MLKVIKDALETGEVLSVRYFGGSNPGVKREIAPIAIIDDKLRATCLKAGMPKIFVIDKMELYVEGAVSKLAENFEINKPVSTVTIPEFLEQYKDTLEGMGWVVLSDDERVSLHLLFKNGKIRKTAIVELTFNEFEAYIPEPDMAAPDFDWDDFIPTDDDGEIQYEVRKKARPWRVCAKDKDTCSFKKPDKAMDRFMSFAKQLAYMVG